jgi:lipoate-protein ligase A
VTAPRWRVEEHEGSAAEFHARDVPLPAERTVWWLRVDRPALVLGSAQPVEVADSSALAATGVELVRRRSGGGAVLLRPGEVAWADVILPAGDPLWDDDVGRATHWLGDAWVAALASCGIPGGVVHRAGLVAREWSRLVCFAGLGPGEVTLGGRKVVGISQRRTRGWARFQCAVPHRWRPDALVELLAEPRPSAAELADLVADVPVADASLREALVAALP